MSGAGTVRPRSQSIVLLGRGRAVPYLYNEAPPQTDELGTVCENSAHLSIF